MHRRTLLLGLPAAAALPARTFQQPLGISLYTVRTPMAADPAATYKRLAEAGVTLLEVRPVNLTAHAAMIRDAGLKPVHMFIDSAIITGAWDEWRAFGEKMAARFKMPPPSASAPRPRLEEMIELARQHGVRRIGVSMLLPGERATAIDRLNAAAEVCARGGVELYYHNHAWEFAGARGSRFIDTLHGKLDRRVRLELDTFWAAAGQDDPAALIALWKGRVRSLHLKDITADAPRGAEETSMPPAAFREVGKGTLNWAAILKAAQRSGVDYYLIEQDFTTGDPVTSVAASVSYLRGLSV